MKKRYDLSQLPWTLSGHTPYLWQLGGGWDEQAADTPPISARVPGSVQAALRDAGILPDWTVGANARECEWVENRHWVYKTRLPDGWAGPGLSLRLKCLGLDHSGWVYVNDQEVGTFKGTHVPHCFDLTPHLRGSGDALRIVFDLSPRWLGQFGYTSQMTEWKTRFNYTWDWVQRLVQIGIWDDIYLEATDGTEIVSFGCTTDADLGTGTGLLRLDGKITGDEENTLRLCLSDAQGAVKEAEVSVRSFNAEGISWQELPIALWWPNGEGNQPLYTLTGRLLDREGNELDAVSRRVGFKHAVWERCEGAPEAADPWLCIVNGRPTFLQGVNFAPIRANYADLTEADYRKRLALYQQLGANLLRLNACGFLEKQWFYDICDELGLMVWQEFPLTSAGIENWPPEDPESIKEMERIARSFISRRRHHVSLTLWSGGNELQGDLEGNKRGMGKPCDSTHPMLGRLGEIAAELDPGRRYIPTSPTGPRFVADPKDFGKGLHWNVHGPYGNFPSKEARDSYWQQDDALFRAELCCPGANPAEIIRRYKGEFSELPATAENPYWRRPTAWWLDWQIFLQELGREPTDLEEYVAWSQAHQAESLALGVRTCKQRFPRCGGVLLWTGHDTWQVPSNTSIVDYDGNPKPAALALAEIWKQRGEACE